VLDAEKQLSLIREAQGDPALLAFATVDLTFSGLPEAERLALRSALAAAAIPHWCDAGILAELDGGSGAPDSDAPDSGAPNGSGGDRWARLKRLPVVEPFQARGTDAADVHEASRLAIRKYLADKQRDRFIALSSRAVAVFETDTSDAGRIERIYHLLVADPDRAATELGDSDLGWYSSRSDEDLAALATVLAELDTARLLSGRALVRARLVVAQYRADRTGAAAVTDLADDLLKAARATGDEQLTGDAWSLASDAAEARGDLAAAAEAVARCRIIFERLAAADPASPARQRDLAAAHARVGDVARARGDFATAEQAFGRFLAIAERMAATDPDETGWQLRVAFAQLRIGDLALLRNDVEAAAPAIAEYLEISERLAALDPANTGWQRNLASAQGRAGDVAALQGDLAAAEQAFAESLATTERLAALDPVNTTWQREVAAGYSRVGDLAMRRGDLAAADRAYAQWLAICARLAALDAKDAAVQRELGAVHGRLGHLAEERGDLAAARRSFAACVAIAERLAALDPDNAVWRQDLEWARSRMAGLAPKDDPAES
jgi:tetratricopeptide (TPR) repeat protein